MNKQIEDMTTIEELYTASEYEKYPLHNLIARARVLVNDEEYNNFIEHCKSFETSIDGGSWSISQPKVK